VKFTMFQLYGHRELPDDFEQRYESVWVDPPFLDLADPARYGEYFRWSLDESVYAARNGMDAVSIPEHHQNAYGGVPAPNLFGAAFAYATRDLPVGVMQQGSTLPTTQPALRVAEEYAILDCLSDGRLIAGFPLGTPMDANYCYGVTPLEQRERYREAHDLIMKAWTTREVFSFNGRYQQLSHVNIWPHPVQTPHPPVWIPGVGSLSTWDWVAEKDYAYAMIAALGKSSGHSASLEFGKRFWQHMQSRGMKYNPNRVAFAILVACGETDAEAERLYAKHVEYFQHKCTIYGQFASAPGYQDYRSLLHTLRSFGAGADRVNLADDDHPGTYREYAERQNVVAGGWRSVVDQIRELAHEVGFGNFMAGLQFGSIPHELALYNIDIFCKKVIPALRDEFSEYEDRWWPEKLLAAKRVPEAVAGS
jgi:alkanesulfonate monooxygenase SsuD/methylene tetrahydromethanopterin reductase-like flavin-dependent oxidoreductase (luciferase family)